MPAFSEAFFFIIFYLHHILYSGIGEGLKICPLVEIGLTAFYSNPDNTTVLPVKPMMAAPLLYAGLSSLGVPPGVPWHPQILAEQLTLSQPRGADYAHQIILAPPDFQTFRRPCYDILRTLQYILSSKCISPASQIELPIYLVLTNGSDGNTTLT